MALGPGQGLQRIGEFARRVGVNPELLRAWERRYGLLQPVRTEGGFRLYTAGDADRVARMQQGLDQGLSAAQAAAVALGLTESRDAILPAATDRMLGAIAAYDEATVNLVLDEHLAAFGIETVLVELILPVLTQVGQEWERDPLEISREHFASHLIRGRLLALARLWGRGSGPQALLACVPGEAHDITLMAFGLLLRSYGWRILFLGADTPIATLMQTINTANPEVVVLTSFDPKLLEAQATALRRLQRATWLVLSGPGASEELCSRIGCRRLDGDLVGAARSLGSGSALELVEDELD